MVGRVLSREFSAFGIVNLVYQDMFEGVLLSNGDIKSIVLVKGRVVGVLQESERRGGEK